MSAQSTNCSERNPNSRLFELVVKGNPWDRGLTQGQLLAEHIRPRVERLWDIAQKHRKRIRPALEKTVEFIENTCPSINQEIRGIGEGAELAFEKVFLYNNRDIVGAVEADFCSVLAVASGDSVVVGMNKDAPVNLIDRYILKKVYPTEGYRFLGYGHVGRLWGHGMNGRGLCTAGAAASPLDNEALCPSMGLYFLPPLILTQCAAVTEAVDLVMSLKTISGAGNLLLADAHGQSTIIELSPAKRIIRKAEDGMIFATNFFASGQIPHEDKPAYLEESKNRFHILDTILHRPTGTPLEKAADALKAHTPIASVCRHDVLGFATALSWVALPMEKKLLLCQGFPCQSDYMTYTL